MGNTIQLPRDTKEGKPRISYSQIQNWKELKSFNLKIEGKMEYMIEYFMGYNFPDQGWGEFGQDVEEYIGTRGKADKFTDEEKAVLDTIEPLGVLSDEFEIDFGEFVLVGIIDDRTKDWSKIRDYKTASKNSAKKYEEDEYFQLDVYALKTYLESGFIPELEVKIIERKGNCMFTGGREVLTVGKEIWTIERKTSEERLEALKREIITTAIEISEYYKQYLKLTA